MTAQSIKYDYRRKCSPTEVTPQINGNIEHVKQTPLESRPLQCILKRDTENPITNKDCISISDIKSNVILNSWTGVNGNIEHGKQEPLESKTFRCIPIRDIAEKQIKDKNCIPISDIIKNNVILNTWTGVSTTKLLNAIVDCVQTISPESGSDTLSLTERIILVLIKLKTNLSFGDIAAAFGLTTMTVSGNFFKIVSTVRAAVQSVVVFQSKDEIKKNLPTYFKKHFPEVRAILDSIEISIQVSKCANCKIKTYSHWKRKNTAKLLVCITPSGTISYVSKAYPCNASDKQIILKENLIDKFDGDVDEVLVNRHFLIATELQNAGIKLWRPYFSNVGDVPLTKNKVLINKQIARATLPAELAIQRLKIFQILCSNVEHNILPYLDDILVIVSAISNLTKPSQS